MKKRTVILLVILILLTTAATLVYMEVDSNRPEPEHVPGNTVELARKLQDEGHSLVMTEEYISMQVGQSHQCKAQIDDGSAVSGLGWRSSNRKIAVVDANGRVTAVAPGEAVITADMGNLLEARVTVAVFGDLSAQTADAITRLSREGSDGAMKDVEDLARMLTQSNSAQAAVFAAPLQALCGFRDLGAGSSGGAKKLWNELSEAVKAAGITSLTPAALRNAALAAYCQGEKSAADLTISFAGDCTFAYYNESDGQNRFPYIYRHSGSVTYPLDLTREVFAADHLTMVNLEGALTDLTDHKDKQFYFRGDPSYVNILTGSSVEAVSVENNHVFDYFDAGFNDTLNALRGAGIRYTTFHSPSVIDKKPFRVVMLSLSMVSSKYLAEFREQIESDISRYRADDTIIIVNLHWGVEGENVPELWQVDAAHSIIDAGADMIIGHHPHVLQGIEVYKGHYIVYSLGNFSFGGNSSAYRPDSMIFRVSYIQDSSGKPVLSRVSVVPCSITSTGTTANNYQPTPLFGKDGEALVSRLADHSAKLRGGVRSIAWNRIP